MKRRSSAISSAVLGVALLTAVPAWADYDAGAEAAQRGDYTTAMAQLLPEAERGDPRAEVAVANMYRRGYGVTRDYAEAVRWYRAAAEHGVANAQYNLAVHYREGLGVERDDDAATRWFREAARQGLAPAQINLGLRYAQGRPVERDPGRGYAGLHRAAMQGNMQALRRRNAVGRDFSAEQLAAARALAETLRPRKPR